MSSSCITDLSNDDLRHLVKELICEVAKLRVHELEDENAALKEELKGHQGRLKLKPSGMDRATEKRPRRQGSKKKAFRASRQKMVVSEEHKLSIAPPPGARFKGYDDFVVRELQLEARIIRYRRERWQTAEGKTLVAPFAAGSARPFWSGAGSLRFASASPGPGDGRADQGSLDQPRLIISKRQVQRLLTGDVAAFAKEADAMLRAGLSSASWITADDTGARHHARNGVITQDRPLVEGWGRFSFFATTFSKNRKYFMARRSGWDTGDKEDGILVSRLLGWLSLVIWNSSLLLC